MVWSYHLQVLSHRASTCRCDQIRSFTFPASLLRCLPLVQFAFFKASMQWNHQIPFQKLLPIMDGRKSMNDCRSESRSDNKRVTSGQRDMKNRCEGVSRTASDDERLLENSGWWNGLTRQYFRTGRLNDSVCKSVALVAQLLAKFPLVVIFLLVALYAIPVSVAVLGVYFFVTFALAVPSFLVLYFAFPRLNWLIREISA